jgi:hypothetical protein
VPSPLLLPIDASSFTCLTPAQKSIFESVAASASAQLGPDADLEAASALGPGLLNLHLVTDEWVQAQPPLYQGCKGPFKREAPQTRAEYLHVVAALLYEAHRWADTVPQPDSIAERVETLFWARIQSGPGASMEDFHKGVCKGRFGGVLCLYVHLWGHAMSAEVRFLLLKTNCVQRPLTPDDG